MLDENYNVKIIDFGDARRVDEADDEPADNENDPQNVPTMQRRFTFVGTVNYQCPEVISGDDQGYPVDVWALGCILFKMFCGFVPFKGVQQMQVHRDIKERKIGWPEKENLDKIMSIEA